MPLQWLSLPGPLRSLALSHPWCVGLLLNVTPAARPAASMRDRAAQHALKSQASTAAGSWAGGRARADPVTLADTNVAAPDSQPADLRK